MHGLCCTGALGSGHCCRAAADRAEHQRRAHCAKPARFGIDYLPATLVFDYPSIAALAQFLAAVQPSSSLSAAPPPAVAVPAAHAQDAAWLARASEVASLSCRYPGSNDGESREHDNAS